ncbi:MAG: DUF4962 domain-containing protein [Ruminococcaceae bacterium]|nr:DUF4962 domain-containing protein [Oscillospiraceae bacterium]
MQHLCKRLIAMLLLVVLVIGILPVFPGTASAAVTYPKPSEAHANLLTASDHNYDFETADPVDPLMPKGWKELAPKAWASFKRAENPDGGHYLEYKVVSGGSGYHAVLSEPIPVADYQGDYLYMSMDVKADADNVPLNAYVYFYKNADTPTSLGSIGVAGDGLAGNINAAQHTSQNWKTVTTTSNGYYTANKMKVPSDAQYARVVFYKAYTGMGTVYIDNIRLYPICEPETHTYNNGNASMGFYETNACQTTYYKRCDNCDYCRQMTDTRYHVVVGEPNHDLISVPANAPTENTTGNIAYWACNDCGNYFADAEGMQQIADKDSVILGKRYTNLLENLNFSFEGGLINGDDPEHWITYDSSNKYHLVTDETAKDGTNSLKLFTDNTSPAPRGIKSPYVTVAGMEKISVLFHHKGTTDSTVYMYFYDGSKTRLTNIKGEPSTVIATPCENWSSYHAAFTVPTGAVYAQIMFYKSNAADKRGNSYFDNVIIKEYQEKDGPSHELTKHDYVAPTETTTGSVAFWECTACGKYFSDNKGRNEITDKKAIILAKRYSNMMENYNPGFEGGVQEGDDPVLWTAYDKTNKYYSVSDEMVYAGSYALKLNTEGAKSPIGLRSQMVNITGMSAVSVSFYVHGDSPMLMYVYFYDAGMNQLSPVNGELTWMSGTPMNQWTKSYGKFTAPEGAVYARLMAYKSNESQAGISYVDEIILKEYQKGDEPPMPTEINESFEEEPSKNGLPWGWSFYTQETNGNVEVLDVTNKDNPAGTPTTAPDGNHIFRFTQVEQDPEVGKLRGFYTNYIDVSNMKAVAATVDMTGLGATQIYIWFADEAYNSPENSTWRAWGMDEYANDWGQYFYETSVPEGAKYARLLIVKSYNAPYHGTVYLDKVTLKETELTVKEPVYPPVPEEKHYDYQILESDHPRVYFNDAELRRMKKWTQNDSLTSFGYSGMDVYKDLLKEADTLMAETHWIYRNVNVTFDIQLYPKLVDVSLFPQLELPPGPGYATPYPYMTRINQVLRDKVKTLALAYVLTGNEDYGMRAVQYALDMCDWKAWSRSYAQDQAKDPSEEQTAQPHGYIVTSLAVAYDMCYDLLTDAQREKIETNLIERGLEPIYSDVARRMARGRDDDSSAVMYTAACAIINEENLELISKYLDRELQYGNWIFDWYDMGHNEGYDYAANGIEQQVEGMAMVERVTGVAGHLDHHFFQETLPAWIKGFVEMGNGTVPGYSDSPYIPEFTITLGVMAKRGEGDQAAGYCLYLGGGADTPFEQLLYTNISDDYIFIPDEDYMNVTVVDVMGVGALRTGWEKDDKLMVMISDDYPVGHAHWECNSIFMAMNGEWVIKDPGYGSIQAGVPKTEFDMKQAVNSIFVDNKPQTVKGAGTIKEVVNSELYGHIVGSAPAAFGKYDGVALVDKFDRHTIMLNHDSESYYVVIDDLASTQEHVYGFNMHHNAWERLELDGVPMDTTKTTSGNHMALLRYGMVLHTEFVGKPLEFSAPYFVKAGQSFGPLLRANSQSTKNHQFMTVISVDPAYEGITTIDSTGLLSARNSNLEVENPDGFSWSSSNDGGMVIGLPMPEYGLNMFRARDVGDWMSFPIEVEEAGDYLFSMRLGKWSNYGGIWQVYLDGEPIGEPYSARGNNNVGINVQMTRNDGKNTINLTEGKHVIKVVLVDEPRTDDLEWGTLISMGVVILEKEGAGLGDGPVKVLESYDDGNVLGATIGYGTVLKDVVLSNRGNGTITGGKLTTDGQQATVLGLHEDEITEGYTILNGTSAKYGDQMLVQASGKMTLAVDYRFAKIPVLNSEVEEDELLEQDEDFDPKKPTTLVTTSATEDRDVSILVGTDVPYTVSIDGETVDASYEDGVLSLSVPKGDHKLEIVGTHTCVFDQKATNILNVKSWATCTEPAVYYVSCYCGENGTETFEYGEPKGHKIVAVEAKEATAEADGCIAHYACKTCKAVFEDAAGTKALNPEDVIIPMLTSDAVNNTAGNNTWIIWVAVAGGVVIAGAVAFVIWKKKSKTAK